jgi:hypothetical protein
MNLIAAGALLANIWLQWSLLDIELLTLGEAWFLQQNFVRRPNFRYPFLLYQAQKYSTKYNRELVTGAFSSVPVCCSNVHVCTRALCHIKLQSHRVSEAIAEEPIASSNTKAKQRTRVALWRWSALVAQDQERNTWELIWITEIEG